MGAFLARSLIEDDTSPAHDFSSLIMIAPVNQGSHLAKVQTLVQLMNGLQAINGKKTTSAMMHLSDGLGQAAEDMLPGSVFLKRLNARPAGRGLLTTSWLATADSSPVKAGLRSRRGWMS